MSPKDGWKHNNSDAVVSDLSSPLLLITFLTYLLIISVLEFPSILIPRMMEQPKETSVQHFPISPLSKSLLPLFCFCFTGTHIRNLDGSWVLYRTAFFTLSGPRPLNQIKITILTIVCKALLKLTDSHMRKQVNIFCGIIFRVNFNIHYTFFYP